jgi:8-oxo-dGTP pyrophosphatase MutT (NUDIX family)
MSFLLESLTRKLEGPLPGRGAHQLLAPIGRELPDPSALPPGSYTPSSVLVLLYPGPQGRPHFPLVQRVASPGVHGGQVALPGGRIEVDESEASAALRECREEIGLAEEPRLIGKLSPLFIPVSGYLVHPFVAVVERSDPRFTPQPAEVEAVIPASLDRLLDASCLTSDTVPVRGTRMTVPCFRLSDKTVWGATAMILNELRVVLQRTVPGTRPE